MDIDYKNEKFNLNKDLLEKQGITDISEIVELHKKRIDLFEEAASTRCSCTLKLLAKSLQRLEFQLQEAWGFDENANFHSWWFRIPNCTCPKMDNAELVGTNRRIISDDCIVHGKKHNHCSH